jgi:DNA processing protein
MFSDKKFFKLFLSEIYNESVLKNDEEKLKHQVAITQIPGIGPVLGKTLVSYCGSPEAVFRESKKRLERIPGISEGLAASIVGSDVMKRVEEEVAFVKKNNISVLFFTGEEYPHRLKHCEDAPVLLYYKGKGSLNHERVLAIVGTRKATDYGRKMCESIVAGLASLDVCIVSGLAYGIDTAAHKTAVKNSLPTFGILAHGLDTLYPPENKSLASKMMNNGGVVTEFISGTKLDPAFFPRRNRIIAGMSDAVVVIESKVDGGGLITAEIANTYNRDVFAIPGRTDDKFSAGCNYLIKANKAALVESAEDIIQQLGWQKKDAMNKPKPSQLAIFNELKEDEKELVNILQQNGKLPIDSICLRAKLPMSKVSSALLNLEFQGLVRSLPGKMYSIA